MGFVTAAVQSHMPPGKAAVFVVGGIVAVIIGLTAIVSPGSFRSYPLNPGQPPRPVWAGHDAVARVIGAIFCAVGMVFVIVAIMKVA